MSAERNIFEEVEEVEQLVIANGKKLDKLDSKLDTALGLLNQIVALLEPPVKPAVTLVLTLGKPVPQ